MAAMIHPPVRKKGLRRASKRCQNFIGKRLSAVAMEKGSYCLSLNRKEGEIKMEKQKSVVASVESKGTPDKKWQAMSETSRKDSVSKDQVETVLREVSKEIAAVVLLMPPIPVRTDKADSTSIKTKDSFDTSFSTLDSDEGNTEEWIDELEEELVGLHLL